MNIKYVTLKKFSELSGFTESSIRSRISRGDWLEDFVWKRVPGGATLVIIIDGYYKWVEGSTGGSLNG